LRTGAVLPVLFNPEEYSVEAGNSFAELAVPGSRTPPLQFTRGQARRLQLGLFLDTEESKTSQDVLSQSVRITAFLDKDPATRAPPVLLFLWGSFRFRGVIERVGQPFTRFLPSGLPVRATLNVTMVEYEAVAVEARSGLAVVAATAVTAVAGAT